MRKKYLYQSLRPMGRIIWGNEVVGEYGEDLLIAKILDMRRERFQFETSNPQTT